MNYKAQKQIFKYCQANISAFDINNFHAKMCCVKSAFPKQHGHIQMLLFIIIINFCKGKYTGGLFTSVVSNTDQGPFGPYFV